MLAERLGTKALRSRITKVSNSWIGGSKTVSKAIGETSPKLLQQLCEPAPEKAAARKAQNNPGKGDYFR